MSRNKIKSPSHGANLVGITPVFYKLRNPFNYSKLHGKNESTLGKSKIRVEKGAGLLS